MTTDRKPSFIGSLEKIPGLHVDARDGDADDIGRRVARIMVEISDLAFEAVRVRDQHREQLDRLSHLLADVLEERAAKADVASDKRLEDAIVEQKALRLHLDEQTSTIRSQRRIIAETGELAANVARDKDRLLEAVLAILEALDQGHTLVSWSTDGNGARTDSHPAVTALRQIVRKK